MKVYNVSINGLSFQPSASNRATAIRRALNAYLNDPDISPEARTSRKRDKIGKTIEITIMRIK